MITQPITKHSVLVLLIAIPFLMGSSVDLFVPSLPIITDYYHVPISLTQLTVGAYMLSYAFGQLFLGALSDSVGRKKVMLYSAIFYTIVSFAAPHATNIYWLIAYRFFQGLGTAGMSVAIRATTVDIFSGLALNKALTNNSIGWSLGPIVGPFIGSYLQHFFNWQADFYFFGCYGLVLCLIIALFLPETLSNKLSMHPLKILNSMKTICMHPLFLLLSVVGSFTYALLVIFNVVGPFLIQETLHYSVTEYGRIALLLGVAYFLGNVANRWLINFFQPQKVALIALISALLIGLTMIVLAIFLNINLFIIVIPTLLIFICCGLILPNMIGMMAHIFPDKAGMAGALQGFIRSAGVSLLSMIVTVLNTSSQIPLAVIYVTILGISLVMLIVSAQVDKKNVPKSPS